MILYIENRKDTAKNLLELINEFSKIEGYKINIQKSAAFLYTNTYDNKTKFSRLEDLTLKFI